MGTNWFTMASRKADMIKEILNSPYLQIQPLGKILDPIKPSAGQKLYSKIKGVEGRRLNEQEETAVAGELVKIARMIIDTLKHENKAVAMQAVLSHPVINKNGFAALVYPDKSKKDASALFIPKLHQYKYRKLTNEELYLLSSELTKVALNITSRLGM